MSEEIYTLMFRLYPLSFRKEYEGEALQLIRDRLRDELEARGIGTGLHYPVPVHLQKAFAPLGYREGDFPVTERIARECLTLPLFPEMTNAQQDRVVDALREVLGEEQG